MSYSSHSVFPSLLAFDLSNAGEELRKLEKAGCQGVHLDVMDNHFVPNLTFGPKFIKNCRIHFQGIFSLHLMIENPERSIDAYLDSGVDRVAMHVETMTKIVDVSNKVRKQGKDFYLALNPKTSIQKIEPYLPWLDGVLVMTVNPGFSGQALLSDCLHKITEIKTLASNLPTRKKKFDIQVDGGINPLNIKQLSTRGATSFVLGSSFFKSSNYAEFLQDILSILKSSTS